MERARLIPHHLQLHTGTMRGRVDSLTWKLPDELSEGEWIEAGIVLARIGTGLMWWVGDYWIYGEKNYGDRKAIVDDPNWQGPSFQTCANAASVCRAFETSRRREVLSFGHHAEVAALDVKEADRLLDWAQATIATTGKPRSTKDLRREVRQSRIRPGVASSSPTVQAELETKNLKKSKQHRSLAKIEQELIRKDAYIAELEAARDQRPSASAAFGIRTATVKQLIDALVVRATGKADSEIAQIVCEITERLNKLQRIRTCELAKQRAPNARMPVPKTQAQDRRPARGNRAGDAHPFIKNGKEDCMSKLVDMAVVDDTTDALQVRKVPIESVTVNIRNHDFKARKGRMFNDVISGPVLFRPGEVKRLEVSTAVVAELKAYKLARRRGAFEVTHESPTTIDADEAEATDETDEMEEALTSEAMEADESPRVRRGR